MARRRPRRRNYAARTSWQPRGTRNPVVSRRARGALAVLIIAAIAGAYVMLFSPLFATRTVEVKGATTIDAEAVRRSALEGTERRVGPIVSDSLVVADPAAVSARLTREFGDLAKVRVEKHWPNKLVVDVTERQSTLLWQSRENFYLVDRQGVAFERTGTRDDLIKVEDSTGLPVEVGKQVAASKFIIVLEDIRREMEAAGFKVVSFRIPESTFEVQAIVEQGYYALFDTTRSVSFQVDALKRATGQTRPREYADLRVPGRVYVR